MSTDDYRTPSPKALGKAIVGIRERRGWTQGQLATLLKMSQPHVSDLEHSVRAPSWRILMRLSHVMGSEFVAVLANVLLDEIKCPTVTDTIECLPLTKQKAIRRTRSKG